MTGNLCLSSNVVGIEPIPVGMPNGAITIANKLGSVKLNEKLSISDVLFVPSLNCNLISIAQLIEDLYCIVTFTHKLYVIQYLTTKMPIGSGEQRKGVYFYNGSPTAKIQVNKDVSHDFWHQRMRHPSNQELSYLSSTISGILSSNSKRDLCDVCLKAKQTRLPFSVSENKVVAHLI